MRRWLFVAPILLGALAACEQRAEPAAEAPAVQVAKVTGPEPVAAPLVAPAAGPAVAPSDDGSCGAICAATRELGCGSEIACLTACGEMRASTACSPEIVAFLSCAAKRKAPDWECGDNEMPSLRDNVCDAEQSAIATCLERLTTP